MSVHKIFVIPRFYCIKNVHKAVILLHELNVLYAGDDDFVLMSFTATARPQPPTSRPPIGCRPGQSPCRTAGQCVPSSAICDGRFDCQDFSDEDNCGEFS